MEEKKLKLEVMKPQSIVKLEVGTGFYYNIRRLFFWYIQQDNEKAIKAIERLKTQEPQDEYEVHLSTLMSLVYGIEEKAKEQGCLDEKEMTLVKPA